MITPEDWYLLGVGLGAFAIMCVLALVAVATG